MPMQMSVRVTDHGVYQGLRKLGEGLPLVAGDTLWEFMQLVQRKASGGYIGGDTYTDVPTRGYMRTGNYGRSFMVEKNGLTFKLTNATYNDGREYGKLVGGDGYGYGQAEIHVGWWPVIYTVLTSMVDLQLVQLLGTALDQLIRDANLND